MANGLANLHNARRARCPVVNLVREQPTWRQKLDAPLQSDIDALGTGWTVRCAEPPPAGELAATVDAAVAAAT